MKKIFLALLALAVLSSRGIIFSSLAEAEDNAKGAQVIAYYFHGGMRCPTCHKLERYSKEAIETNFKDALATGKLEYKIVNVEDKDNEHYTSDYQLYTKSLILSLVKDGKELKWKNLDKIWGFVGNKQKYLGYVKEGVADFLKEAK